MLLSEAMPPTAHIIKFVSFSGIFYPDKQRFGKIITPNTRFQNQIYETGYNKKDYLMAYKIFLLI